MTVKSNRVNADRPKKILILASNATTSPVTGWPIGFWWGELTHPWFAFTEAGYEVTIASPDGGDLTADSWSDPRDDSGYSAHDILSLGFISSPDHAALVHGTAALADLDHDSFDAIFLVGGQGPMVTFFHDDRVHAAVRRYFEAGKVTALLCHATSVLLKATTTEGTLLVEGRTWTGFADAEEAYADEFVGQRIQPFHIESEARKLKGTNFIQSGPFAPFAVRDGNLVTGQQQYASTAAARLVIAALGG